MKRRNGPPITLAERVDGQVLSDQQREMLMATGAAMARLRQYVLNPGVSDCQAGPLLREFLHLTQSRQGACDLLLADLCQSPLPYLVAQLRTLRPWRAELALVVDNT